MSDPKSSYGEPVEEPGSVDDVVGRANEGLADAEAAGRDAVADDTSAASEPAEPAAPASAEPTSAEPASAPAPAEPSVASAEPASEPASAEPASAASDTGGAASSGTAAPGAAEPDPWDSPEAASLDYRTPAADADRTTGTAVYGSASADAPTEVVAPAVTPSEPFDTAAASPAYASPAYEPSAYEPAVAGPAVVAAAAPQPIFVQAPEAPRPRGNRAAAGGIGLLAALSFAVLYLAVWLGVGAIEGTVTGENLATTILDALGTWSLWVPVVVFFIAFWLLGAIINRGRWGAWVVFGLLVGAAAYGGHLLGALFQAPFWELTARQGSDLVESQLLTPLAFAAFVIGRELTIWFGAWAASRGRRVTELNVEAQREYERTLEAGPQLVRQ